MREKCRSRLKSSIQIFENSLLLSVWYNIQQWYSYRVLHVIRRRWCMQYGRNVPCRLSSTFSIRSFYKVYGTVFDKFIKCASGAFLLKSRKTKQFDVTCSKVDACYNDKSRYLLAHIFKNKNTFYFKRVHSTQFSTLTYTTYNTRDKGRKEKRQEKL